MKVAIYYPSWSSNWSSTIDGFDLSQIDKKYPGLTCVYIAFVRPDLSYVSGSKTFANTGLEFSTGFGVVKGAIDVLKSRGICVMLSVGGGAYWSVDKKFNVQNLVDLTSDLGVDGLDIDFEMPGKAKDLTNCIRNLRAAYKGYISFAGWSTGAYPDDGSYSGSALDAIKSVGNLVDAINIMAYDAGDKYDPQQAYQAYRSVYSGPLLLGFETGNPGWGGYVLTAADVVRNVGFMKKQRNDDGIFVWCDKKDGTPSPQDVIKAVGFNTTPPPPPPLVMQIICPQCKTVFKK